MLIQWADGTYCTSGEEFFNSFFTVEMLDFAKEWGMLETITDVLPDDSLVEEDLALDFDVPQMRFTVTFRFVFFMEYASITLEDDVPEDDVLGMLKGTVSEWELGQIRKIVAECRNDEQDALFHWGSDVKSRFEYESVAGMELYIAEAKRKEKEWNSPSTDRLPF